MECTNRMCPGEQGEVPAKRIAAIEKKGKITRLRGEYVGIICEWGISR